MASNNYIYEIFTSVWKKNRNIGWKIAIFQFESTDFEFQEKYEILDLLDHFENMKFIMKFWIKNFQKIKLDP